MEDRQRLRGWTPLAVAGAGAGAAALALLLLRNSTTPRKPSTCSEPVDFASYLVTPVATDAEAASSSSSSRWDRKRTKAAETSFDSFLKQRAEPDPADFSSFLRNGGNGGGNAAASSAPKAAAEEEQESIPADRAPVLVLYGTEYGFAREIAEKLADAMKKMTTARAADAAKEDAPLPWPVVADMADASPSLLAAQQAALLVCSTQGDGVPPTEAREFCEWVFAGCKGDGKGDAAADAADAADAANNAAPPSSLAPPRHSVLALGDSSYAHFCRCGKMLDAALAAAGSEPLAPRVDVDKEDWKAVDGWIAAVLAALPALGLRPLSALGGAATTVALGGDGSGPATTKKPLAWSKSRPFPARVAAVEPLCRGLTGDWRRDKVTARVELDISGAGPEFEGYAPGDALGIYPLNAPPDVDALLLQVAAAAASAAGGSASAAGADEEGRRRLAEALGRVAVPTPAWHYAELEPAAAEVGRGAGASAPLRSRPPVAAPRPAELPLREALARCYDLRAPKGEPLLRALRDALAARGGVAAAAAATTNGNGNGHPSPPEATAAAPSDDEARRLDALLSGGKEAVDAYLEPRHVIDVLREHPAAAAAALSLGGGAEGKQGATIAAAPAAPAAAALAAAVQRVLLPHLRQLQPRLYSISSSPLESPGRVQATIAVVRYESLGHERVGVCSTYAAERVEAEAAAAAAAAAASNSSGSGRADNDADADDRTSAATTTMRVYIHRNPDFRLPADASTPVIMVGPGTGLAPFRAFVIQRLLERRQRQRQRQQQQQQKRGASPAPADADAPSVASPDADNMVLFFGSRRRDQDYLYGDQLEAWARDGALSLHTAFSREPGQPKVYVQQRLREQGERVWRLLDQKRAHFYVCGDASSMAPAVEEELLRVMREVGGLSEAEAAARLEAMAAEGRYQRDVWFG